MGDEQDGSLLSLRVLAEQPELVDEAFRVGPKGTLANLRPRIDNVYIVAKGDYPAEFDIMSE